MNILFVCTGNTCRSPMAEAILKSKWPEDQVRSAGVFAGENQLMATHSEMVLEEKGFSLNHKTSQIKEDLLEWADLVLTMTDRHKQTLTLQFPKHEDKYFTLKEYVLVDQGQWSELKNLYSTLEEKRSAILKENSAHLTESELEEVLQKELFDEISQIRALEQQFPDVNVLDPFGGNVNVYRETRDELEKYIELLVKKLENRDK
ncbi:low molecular weight protein arginine phosphatase [Halobacillus litoralis]|uniref:low molecular weight protein arginine phosphatase n=1 Tax=Halobacillus litoralis TaxID=45668 RepID=UPI001CD78095|nr:low molecular weight protein arginine phosphatase [Halobacillus litoralis]MCA0971032.1 low molecular weight protein arginine phosphatase [Halobacillus litoralis]